jgi:5-methylthioadenosine/S-adenosylhomocysteine deaminase
MYSLCLHNCQVLQFTEAGQPKLDLAQDILIDGATIAAIVPTDPAHRQQAQELIDARDQLALPGLINTHAHVPMVLFRGLAEDVTVQHWFNDFIWPVESNLTPDDVYWGALLGLVEMIEAGVTTVADHYFAMDRVAQAVTEAGTRALLGWAVFGSQGYAALDQTAAFVERWHGAA